MILELALLLIFKEPKVKPPKVIVTIQQPNYTKAKTVSTKKKPRLDKSR